MPRPIHRSPDFRGPQCWLDDPDDTYCHLVLQIENILKRAVEMLGPEMRAALRFDRLSGNPHPVSALPDRAFEHVAHAEFAPDLFHIDDLAFVGEARIAGDNVQRIVATAGM